MPVFVLHQLLTGTFDLLATNQVLIGGQVMYKFIYIHEIGGIGANSSSCLVWTVAVPLLRVSFRSRIFPVSKPLHWLPAGFRVNFNVQLFPHKDEF